jgi:hypothetical protein
MGTAAEVGVVPAGKCSVFAVNLMERAYLLGRRDAEMLFCAEELTDQSRWTEHGFIRTLGQKFAEAAV